MAEESGTTETTGAETGSIGPEIVVDVTETQGIPAIDESLLMGEETDEAGAETDDTSTKPEGDDSTEETSTEKDTADSGSKEAKETEDTKAEAKADDTAEAGKDETTTKGEETPAKKPPKGYVPLPAMQQAREKNRSLEGENSALKQELDQLRQEFQQMQAGAKQPPKEEGGFKRLSQEELSDLTESSPDEAIKYLAQLQVHQEQEFQQRLEQAQQDVVIKAQREHASQEISSAYQRIETAVPGLYDENSEAWTELTSFAEEVGITPDVFALATTPEALGLLPGQDEPQLVGTKAADFVEALVGLQDKLASRGSRKETMRKELETEIRAEVEKELLAKFKNDGGSEHRSVQDIQGTTTRVDEEEGFGDKVLSHEEFARLSEEEQARYLSGN